MGKAILKKNIVILGAGLVVSIFILFLLLNKESPAPNPVEEGLNKDGKNWVKFQRSLIMEYFKQEKLNPPKNLRIRLAIPPMLGIWSESSPDKQRQLWVISGDCPIDYIVSDSIISPRASMKKFSLRWLDVAAYMKKGEQHPSIRIGDPGKPDEMVRLGELLEKRALLLKEWSEDDSRWVKKQSP